MRAKRIGQDCRKAVLCAPLITLMTVNPCSAAAIESFAGCLATSPPAQSMAVRIPSALGKMLLAEDHGEGDVELPCCGRWWEKDPNDLYLAKAFDLNNDGTSEYIVSTRPEGPRAFGHNNPVWIVQQNNHEFKILLSQYAALLTPPIVLESYTHTFHDICIIQTSTAAEKYELIFGFDGARYRPKVCRLLTYGSDDTPPEVADVQCPAE